MFHLNEGGVAWQVLRIAEAEVIVVSSKNPEGITRVSAFCFKICTLIT